VGGGGSVGGVSESAARAVRNSVNDGITVSACRNLLITVFRVRWNGFCYDRSGTAVTDSTRNYTFTRDFRYGGNGFTT
jgi:hypothetical protein